MPTPRLSPRQQAQLDALEAQSTDMPSGDDLEAAGVTATDDASKVTKTEETKPAPETVAVETKTTEAATASAPAVDYEKQYNDLKATRERESQDLVNARQESERHRLAAEAAAQERDSLKTAATERDTLRAQLEEREREAAMQLNEDELTALGGEDAVKSARKLADQAVALAEKRLTEKFNKVLDERLAQVDSKVVSGVEKVNSENAAKQKSLAFSNAVFTAVPDWNSLIETGSAFQKFLDDAPYKRRHVINQIFNAKDDSSEAMAIVKEMVAEWKGGTKAVKKADFVAPAGTQSATPKPNADAKDDGTISTRDLSRLLRHRELDAAGKALKSAHQ